MASAIRVVCYSHDLEQHQLYLCLKHLTNIIYVGGITTGSFLMGDIHATLYWSWSGGWPNLAFYDHRAHENYTIGGIENLKIGATNYIYAAHSASVSASTTTASSTPYPSPTMDTGGGRVRPPIRGGPEIPPFQGGEGPKV